MRRTPEKSCRSSLGGVNFGFEGVEGFDDGLLLGKGNFRHRD